VNGKHLSLTDERFKNAAQRAKNFHAAYRLLGEIFSEENSEYWISKLRQVDIPCFPVNSLDGLLDDPHLRASGLIQTEMHPTEGEIHTLACPVRWSTVNVGSTAHAPNLGEHTKQILAEFGYSEDEIKGLADRSVTN
jgi:crotonobetainyl-CoA:carnitine CoA-transferase CaiB-like acyl-CoA transferase